MFYLFIITARDLDLVRAEEAITAVSYEIICVQSLIPSIHSCNYIQSIEWKFNRIEKQSFNCWKPPPEFESVFKIHFTGLDHDGRVGRYGMTYLM